MSNFLSAFSLVEEYINIAKEKYGYNSEQALGMLFWHKHDLEKALTDLSNFTPFPDEWSVEDKVLFEQAFQFHGKSFHRIRQMVRKLFTQFFLILMLYEMFFLLIQLPDKSIAALVRYYYSWKKTRARSSLMDRQVRRLTQKAGEETNNAENSEPVSAAAAAAAVPSDSDEDKNDNVRSTYF